MLHIDRNNYYGGQSASLNLNQVGELPGRVAVVAPFSCPAAESSFWMLLLCRTQLSKECSKQPQGHKRGGSWCGCLQLYERFRPGQKPPAELGASRDYNVDLVPKFIMVGLCAAL